MMNDLKKDRNCVSGLNPYDICGSAAVCSEPVRCCAGCKMDCNIRCGYCKDPREVREA